MANGKLYDGFEKQFRPGSTQHTAVEISSVYIGIVSSVSPATQSVFVIIPAINQSAALGPYKCVQPLTNEVSTPVKQTLTTTSGSDPDGGTFLTSASLSSTTTSINGVYGTLNLPSVGDRVLVVLMNSDLDEGAIVGKL
jgi:hypothetical protein